MNRNTFFFSSGGSFASSSSSDDPIYALPPIVSLRAVHESEGSMINDIPSILIEKDIEYLHDKYRISREIFHVFTPCPSVCVDDQISAEDAIMVYEQQLKAGLRFLINPFFTEILRFHRLSITQLHPNN